MRRKQHGRWRWVGLAVVVMACLSPGGAAVVGSVPTMPAVHGVSLAGETVDLPGMLRGKVGVLVVGFSRESRQPVTEWGRRLSAEYDRSGTVAYFEMPMLAEVPRVLRGLVVRSMRREIPEGARNRFVPITEDEAEWKEAVGYGKDEDAYVVVVDGQGRVRGREHGTASDEAFAALKKVVRACLDEEARTRR